MSAIEQAAKLIIADSWRQLRDDARFERVFRQFSEDELAVMLRKQIEEASRIIKVSLDV